MCIKWALGPLRRTEGPTISGAGEGVEVEGDAGGDAGAEEGGGTGAEAQAVVEGAAGEGDGGGDPGGEREEGDERPGGRGGRGGHERRIPRYFVPARPGEQL